MIYTEQISLQLIEQVQSGLDDIVSVIDARIQSFIKAVVNSRIMPKIEMAVGSIDTPVPQEELQKEWWIN